MPKKFHFVSTICIAVVCVIAMALYFVFPIWRVSVGFTFNGAMIKGMLGSEFEDYDIDSSMPEGGIPATMTIDISVPMLAVATFGGGDTMIDSVIDENIDGIAETLTSALGDVTKTIVKAVAVDTIKTEITNQIKEYLKSSEGDDVDDDEVSQIMSDIGLDEEFVNSKAETIVDAIYQPDATVDSVTDEVISIVQESFDELIASGNERVAGMEFDAETEASVREQVQEALKQFANEDGTIDIDAKAIEMLFDSFGISSEASVSEADNPVSFSSTLDGESTDTETVTETASDDQIREQLSEYMHSIITEDAYIYIYIGVIALFVLFLISFACWMYIFIKSLVKLIRGEYDPPVKIKAAIFGWLPGFLLMLVPSIAFLVIKNIGILEEAQLTSLTLSFFSSGLCAAICAGALLIFFIVRHILKNTKYKSEPEPEDNPQEPAENTIEIN